MAAICSNAIGDTANGKTVALIVVVRWVDTAGTEPEVAGVGGTVDRRRPEAAAACCTLTVEAAAAEPAAILK